MTDSREPQSSRNQTGAVAAPTDRRRRPLWLWLLLALLALLLLAWLLYALLHDDKKKSAAVKPTASVSAATTPGSSTGAAAPPASSAAPSGAASTGTAAGTGTTEGAGTYGAALVGGGGLTAKPATGVEAAQASSDTSPATSSPAPGASGASGADASAVSGPQGTVLFASGSAALDPAGLQVISRAAARIKALNPSAVTVTGYTDVVGGQPKNDNLSQRRADAVAAALREQLGTTPPVNATAKGEADPISPNSTAAGRQQNRRASITTTS